MCDVDISAIAIHAAERADTVVVFDHRRELLLDKLRHPLLSLETRLPLQAELKSDVRLHQCELLPLPIVEGLQGDALSLDNLSELLDLVPDALNLAGLRAVYA